MKKQSVITLGTFDGVHRGHQAILRLVAQRARARAARAVALAFGMPPRHAGVKGRGPVLLTTLAEKKALLRRLGIDEVDVLVFDRRTASTSPEDFFQNVIRGRHHACEMVVGPRLAFGKNRTGRLPLLRKLGRAAGVRIDVVRPVRGGVSSSELRKQLAAGQVDRAAKELGYYYSVEGPVVHGDRRGRRIGFPTANVAPDPGKILPAGVFWVKLVSPEEVAPSRATLRSAPDGLCNVGTRPTFRPQATDLHCEIFIFRGRPPRYGKQVRVVFLKRLRGERRFPSAQALGGQIAKDLSRGRKWARSSALQREAFSI